MYACVRTKALGGWLSQQRDKFPQAYKKWEAANTNITALFELINKVSAHTPLPIPWAMSARAAC
jgi:hypothetical protein